MFKIRGSLFSIILFSVFNFCTFENSVYANEGITGGNDEVCVSVIASADGAATVTSSKAVDDIKEQISILAQIQSLSAPDPISLVLGERHTLTDFIEKDFASKNPFVVMNAAQRMLSLVYSQGISKTRIRMSGEEVALYPFFSSGTPVTSGRRIIGNENVVVDFINNLKAQATADRAGSSVILLVGSRGTGKSEFLTILGIGSQNLTSQPESKYSSYTFTWTNLGKILSLRKFLSATEIDGKKVYTDIEAPLGDSPYTLLPPEVQKIVLARATPSSQNMLQGMSPAPVSQPDPISQFLRNEIIQFYTAEKGSPLTPIEIVRHLTDHVVIKRQILGQDYGKMPLIDVQGNDLDIQGLFMTPNPVVKFAAGVGPTHVMAWYLNGRILTGHGSVVMLDEFLKNPKEFRSMLLGAFESRRLAIGGAPTVPFDSVLIAATNTADLDEVRSEVSGLASADRFETTPMRWALEPHLIALGMLDAKKSSLNQQSLAQEDAPVTEGRVDDLVPRSDSLTRILTPDYRYRYWFGEGREKVEVAPHTLLMMAEIIAATRMQTSPEAAGKVFKGKILGSPLLRSPIERIRLYEGLRPDVKSDELKELGEVSLLLKEGETGISHRDANRWMKAVIDASRSEKYGYTMTPGIALKVFRHLLNKGSIYAPSTKVRLEWQDLSREVTAQLLLPRLEGDISRALANGDRVVNDAYFDLIDEMYAIHADDSATTYISSTTGQEGSINRERMEKVREIYKKKNGRDLSISQIAIFHSRQTLVSPVGRVPDESLLDAVANYYASLNTQVAGFSSLVQYERTGVGADEVVTAHASLVASLKRMGYNSVAIRDALMFINNERSRNEAP